MTEAGWTSKKPIVAGWYWWRGKEESGIALVFPADKPMPWHTSDHSAGVQLFYSAGGMSSTRVNDFGGEWLGPITPDSYQQGWVEGLVRGAQLVRWHKSCAFEADPALALERAAKDIESVASQIIQPQQAQEGGVGDGHHSNDDEG